MSKTLKFSLVSLVALGACDHALVAPPEVQEQHRPVPLVAALAAVPAPANIVSWLPGDGNADDIVGTNHGLLINGATFAPGKVGQAFSLTKSSLQYVNMGNDASLHLSSGGDFSMEAWVNFNTVGGDMSILDKMHSPVNGDGWRLLKQGDNRFWFCLGGGSNRCGVSSHTVFSNPGLPSAAPLGRVTTNTWYHVAAVVDVSGSGTFAIYVNGVLHDARGIPAFQDSNSSDLRIGLYATELFSALNGQVDEPTFYSRALSGAEIQGIYEAGSDGKTDGGGSGQCVLPPDGLVSWWDADAVIGTTASDIWGGNDGTLADGATVSAGKVGQAFNFNTGSVCPGLRCRRDRSPTVQRRRVGVPEKCGRHQRPSGWHHRRKGHRCYGVLPKGLMESRGSRKHRQIHDGCGLRRRW